MEFTMNKVERRDNGIFMTLKVCGEVKERPCYYATGKLTPYTHDNEQLLETMDGTFSIIKVS